MTNSAKNIVQFPESQVECYYPALKKEKYSNYRFYRSFNLNNTSYTVGDLIIRRDDNGNNNADIVKLLCIFKYTEQKNFYETKAVVRKYLFARNISKKLKEWGYTQFDKDNEVVEDYTQDYTVNLNQLNRKCFLVYAQISDSPYVIEENNLDPKLYFSCRYSLTSDGIFPALTQIQRDSVKRNLNQSFGHSPEKTRSILNYSIISVSDDEEEKKPLILKLKVSKKNNPQVFLTRLSPEEVKTNSKTILRKINDDYCLSSQLNETAQMLDNNARKSIRKVERISYAEFVSPEKQTPTKRGRPPTKNVSNLPSSLEKTPTTKNKRGRPIKNKTDAVLSTPTKNSPGTDEVEVEEIDSKKMRSKFYFYKSLDEEDSDEEKNVEVTPKKRAIRTPSRYQTESPRSPCEKANISIRRSVLRTRLKINYDESAWNSPAKTVKTRRASSKPSDMESMHKSETICVVNKLENMNNSALKTPRRARSDSTQSEDFESCEEMVAKTPRKGRGCTTPRSVKTPKNPAKLIRDGFITPSLQSRSKIVSGDSTPLMKARSQLHVSYVPSAMPCREKEYCDVYGFLEGKLLDGCGGCMYISGVPGTGKTATVTSVINNLQQHNDDIPKFDFVSLNGMRLTEPRQSYVEILKQLTGKTVPWEQAQSMLEERFTKSKKSVEPCVMLIDELDILCTKRQDVVYNLLDWPTKAKAQLIVITIANTMDLPERLLMSRVTSRLGLTRLTFQAYTHKQLQEIVTKRLCGTDSFKPDAIQFVARKVASVSGDARRALDICRRAAEIAELEGGTTLVSMTHVNEALNAMIMQPKVRAIKRCSRLEQLLMQAIVAEMERTGVEETSFADVYKMLVSVSALDGFKMATCTNSLAAISRLSATRLILADQKCNDIYQRIILNVSIDDVYYALKTD